MRSPIAADGKAIEIPVFFLLFGALTFGHFIALAIFARVEMVFAGLSVADQHLYWSRLGAILNGAE